MTKLFDTLTYTKGAIEAGMNREQAEYHAEQLLHLIDNELLTKQHFNVTMSEISYQFKELESRMTIKLGTIMLAGITILGFILKH